MRKSIGALMALQLGLAAWLPAQGTGVRALFPERPTGYVTDVAGIIDAGSKATIEQRLQHLRDVTGAEVAVVTLPTIANYAPAEVALEVGRAWGVGADAKIGDKRRNAGVVLLLVPRTAEHRGEVNFAIGQGLEGAITDATSGQIADAMIPQLRDGQYGPAADLGTQLVADRVARELGVQDSSLVRPERRSQRVPIRGIIVILVVLFAAVSSRRGGGGRGGGGRWIGPIIFGGGFGRGGFGGFGGGGFGGGFGGGGFGGFGGGGGFSGGGGGRSF